jgi:hypothetical protein
MVEEEYPKNLSELEANFDTDEACRAYLARLRWPRGFVCPHCGSAKAWSVRDRWECGGCGCQTSVTAGTIFQDTRTSLVVWFRAMWWVTTQKNGASALGLQRVLGLKSYETAWTWLHKLRRAMVRLGRDLLTGRVEVDECYIGGLEEGLPGRLNLKKALVVVAAQEDGPGIGRIRMRQIVDASARKPGALCAGLGGPGKRVTHRRVGGIPAIDKQRLPARRHGPEGKEKDPVGVDAACSPCDLPPQTVADGNPPGSGQS